MKIIAALLFTFTAAGCSQPPAMTNKQVIAASKQCNDAGLRAVSYEYWSPLGGDMGVARIQCEPKDQQP